MSSDRIYGTETEYGLYLLQNQASPSGLFLRGLDYIKDIAYLGTKKVDLAKQFLSISGIYFYNGGYFYCDNSGGEWSYTPEFSSPECRSPKDLVLWEKAGDILFFR